MKVGSLVECITCEYVTCGCIKGGIYTIRSIQNDHKLSDNPNQILISLEEIQLPINQLSGNEFGFEIEDFREIQPPMDIKMDDLIEHPTPCEINDCDYYSLIQG